MIVYLFDPLKTNAASIITGFGVELWQKPQDAGSFEIWDQMGVNPLEQIDALLLEITNSDQQINYLLAQAILLQKNTLCFYKRSSPPRQLLMYLKRKNVPHCIQLKAYTTNSFSHVISDYLKSLKPAIVFSEVPHIKFTLRLTESIENYLNWLSKKKKINKADYLRELLKKLMTEDEDYNKKQ